MFSNNKETMQINNNALSRNNNNKNSNINLVKARLKLFKSSLGGRFEEGKQQLPAGT